VDLRTDGAVVWNALAAQCFNGTGECPSRQLAIVLDDVIQSAPTVNAPSFAGAVSITGSFTEDEARALSRVLNRGAFPVGVEAQSVETVSPALGGDTLRAVIVSGLIGAALIILLMVLYYRRIAVVAVTGLIIWAMSMYSATVLVSEATNYALSLAGATGIIVAIGIAVDSYVVLFERLNDELRGGRLLRNAAGRSFDRSWRTIVSANVMSILASVILFTLSVGSVKGFALYLGLTTVVNLLVYFTFARPMVMLLSRANWFSPTTSNERVLAEQGTS
jgi:preprotein translocase subunit SecD